MPAFWGFPLQPHEYPILWLHVGSQIKTRQSQSYKFKEFDKILNFWNLKNTLHATHLLKLLDKIRKYEIDLASIVEDTERTRFCPQMDRRTDGQMDKVKPVYPPSAALSMEYKNCSILIEITCIWYINIIILFTLFSPPKWYFSWTKYPCTHLFHRCSDDPFQLVNQILQKWQCLVITMVADHQVWALYTHIAKFMWPTWGPPGSCQHQMSPKLAPWTSVTWIINITGSLDLFVVWEGPADHPKML